MSIEFTIVVGAETPQYEAQLPAGQQVPWPVDSVVIYALDDDKVVGRMGSMAIKFIEGTWADPSHPTLGFRMMKKMEFALTQLGNTHAMALVYDETPRVADYLEHAGFSRFPVTVYCKEITKKEEAA